MSSPNKPPELILSDAALVQELDYIRQLVLLIPVSTSTYAPTAAAVGAIWNLQERIEWLSRNRSRPDASEPSSLQLSLEFGQTSIQGIRARAGRGRRTPGSSSRI